MKTGSFSQVGEKERLKVPKDEEKAFNNGPYSREMPLMQKNCVLLMLPFSLNYHTR